MVSGARVLVESLIRNGVEVVFGYPGSAVLNIYDELCKCKDRIRHILVSHEQHATHAADGYARSTGRVGVCLATSGPGATNLVTGIATAFVDSIPIVAITGNVSIPLLGKDSFQEVDIAGITMPIVKHNWIVEDIRELEGIIHEAFIVAQSGRPGPVLIDIPKDITSADYELEYITTEDTELHGGLGTKVLSSPCNSVSSVVKFLHNTQKTRYASRTERKTFNDVDIEQVVELIKSSKRPVIFAGGGVIRSGAGEEVKKLAELLSSPVALSLMGMGAFPCDHHLCTGLIGMFGTRASKKAVQKADLLIALGVRFSDRVLNGGGTVNSEESFAKNAKIIHIDIDPAEINKNIRSDAFIIGDLKKVLNNLIKKIPGKISTGWGDEINVWKNESLRRYKTSASKKHLHPRFIIQETAKVLKDDAIIVTDVGQHQIWTAQFYPFKNPRSFLSSGGLGTMGFGLGAAAGAKIANPNAQVALFTGDGCLRMNSAELATLVNYKLPVLIIVFNNRSLGMLRQWQNKLYKSNYYETDLENRGPDFIKLAAAYDVPAFSAADEKSFTNALSDAMSLLVSGKAVLIEVLVNKDVVVS
ncbi:MAG: biosynthetic-type acetolactate synthase large subunit [Treponema sp.]|nr:biosynthetic-type acetolactate synthase large subunit [Treponema sp.]